VLNNNVIFNNTNFVVDPDTFEIQSPLLKNLDVVCPINRVELFRNCFKKLGQGAFGVFYSPDINQQFGIRKLEINIMNKDSLENEISLLRFFRQNYNEFPFVAHMYGWMNYDYHSYIILEHKDTDLKYLLKKSSKNNDDITDIFINIYKIIVAQLKVFTKYNIYHQDLHAGNILIKIYDTPVHITWNGLNIYTQYVPFIHDFDYSGVRGTSIIQNINNTDTVQNQYWEQVYLLPKVQNSISYYFNCYDTYQIFNSMVHYCIVKKSKKTYNISIDLVNIFSNIFNINITDNDFSSLIIISLFDNDDFKIINKKNNVEYKMILNTINFVNLKKNKKNKKNAKKTPILWYTQLNPLFEQINILNDVYDINNINYRNIF
jgi:hypothetical protein